MENANMSLLSLPNAVIGNLSLRKKRVLSAQFLLAEVVQKHVENLAGRHIREMKHQVFRSIGGDCDSRIYFGIQ